LLVCLSTVYCCPQTPSPASAAWSIHRCCWFLPFVGCWFTGKSKDMPL
jgi:hypothetical protein